jgi:hypothetical protein
MSQLLQLLFDHLVEIPDDMNLHKQLSSFQAPAARMNAAQSRVEQTE